MRSFSTIGHALVFERHGVPENVLAFREVVVPDANMLGPHEILVGMLAVRSFNLATGGVGRLSTVGPQR